MSPPDHRAMKTVSMPVWCRNGAGEGVDIMADPASLAAGPPQPRNTMLLAA
jgi:hypothetical protein